MHFSQAKQRLRVAMGDLVQIFRTQTKRIE